MISDIKILVVGDTASIHAARFVSLLQEIGYSVRVFQSAYHSSQDEHLHNTIVYVSHHDAAPCNGNKLRTMFPFEINCWHFRFLLRIIEKYLKQRPRVLDLVKIIKKWNPQIVFSLKMQNDGYTLSEAREILGENFNAKWIHFNWGTDIEFFGKDPNYLQEHLLKIKKLLSYCDFHIADCQRDARQAFVYGFKGESLGTCIAPGGFDLKEIERIKLKANQERKVILIKGRQGGYVGKAYNVLRALHKIPHLIKNYKIRIILASPEVRNIVDVLSFFDGVEYKVIPKVSYAYLLGLFASSRITIAASDVDGTPSFLIESMAMGAFPIHSDMDSIREWVEDGKNGLLFPVDDIDALTDCIERAVKDDALIDKARSINWRITSQRMNREKIKEQLRTIIQNKILSGNGI